MAQVLAWAIHFGEWPSRLVDHEDGDRSNNKLSNLRLATFSQNQWNMGKPRRNKSGIKGVSLNRATGKWCASVKANNKSYYVGTFDLLDDAAKAVAAKREELHGHYANHGAKMATARKAEIERSGSAGGEA
ncbi:MAG: HNH endonuclease [Paraburkholderia tropica]|nr:HNH endonuclease [Paraburkholderia tropica]